MASRREDHGDLGVSGTHEITEEMISDWMSPGGYPDTQEGNAKKITYQGRPAFVWGRREDGSFCHFAWYAWDDGVNGSKRRFCPHAEDVPDDIPDDIHGYSMIEPDMELDEIHGAQELIRE